MIVGAGHGGARRVVLQADHAVMAAELARAWGSDALGGPPIPAVVAAAAGHELGWEGRDAPVLDRSTGLPYTSRALPLASHLPMQLDGPRRLGERDPLAGLLASLKHASRYERPSVPALVRRRHRLVRRFLVDSARLQAELRSRAGAPEEVVDRAWRIVDACDRISHALIAGPLPRTLRAVPAAATATADLTIRSGGAGTHTVAPWPFAGEGVRLDVPARLLHGPSADQEALDAAFAAAPAETLRFELRPPSGDGLTLPG